MNLTEQFNRNFEIVTADSGHLIKEAQRLRYQVLCMENLYLGTEDYPDKLESDNFDNRSVHSLILHRDSGLLVATVRLVLPDPVFIQSRYPIEEFCGELFNKNITDIPHYDRKSLAEISRFSISKQFKKQIIEMVTPNRRNRSLETRKNINNAQHIFFPLLAAGLFKAIFDMSRNNGISCWYALVEPSLFRLLMRYGICFQQIGPVIDFHGKRQPTFQTMDSVLSGIHYHNSEVWDFITSGGRLWPFMEETESNTTPTVESQKKDRT